MILEITSRFPQLALPIQLNISSTPEYRDAVLRGNPTLNPSLFPFSEFDMLTRLDKPADTAEILCFAERILCGHIRRFVTAVNL